MPTVANDEARLLIAGMILREYAPNEKPVRVEFDRYPAQALIVVESGNNVTVCGYWAWCIIKGECK